MPAELLSCDQYIFGALAGSAAVQAALRTLTGNAGITDAATAGPYIVADLAPQGTKPPYLLFANMTAQDTVGAGAIRLATRPTYLVKVVLQGGSYAPAGPLLKAMDDALQAKSTTRPQVIDGVTVRGSYRETSIKYPETTDGITYRHIGGRYRLFVYV